MFRKAGGDAEDDKKKMEEEAQMARLGTFQNILAFGLFCGLIRAAPWLVKQIS